MTVYKWSQTASSNSNSDSTINWAEGQSPSSVNDSARAMMAAVAKWRDDNSGDLVTTGTSTAYAVTTNQSFSSLSAMDGQAIRVRFNNTNGASPTLNVDSLGAKAIEWLNGTAVPSGAIIDDSIHDLVYDNANSAWRLIGRMAGALDAPSGTRMIFNQTAAPTTWTKETNSAYNDVAMMITTGTVGNGGSWTISGLAATAGNQGTSRQAGTGASFDLNLDGHTHPVTSDGSWRPKYQSSIIAVKD
jgi:hypothetical protein